MLFKVVYAGIKAIYFVEKGTVITENTGGLTPYAYKASNLSGKTKGVPSVAYGNGYISVSIYEMGGTAFFNNPINVTDLTELSITVSWGSTKSGHTTIVLSQTKADNYTAISPTYLPTDGSSKTLTVNVASLTGNVYVGIEIQNSTIYVTDIHFKKKNNAI